MILAVALMTLGILSRFIVHVPNFTPVIAIALFSGVYIPKRYSIILPIIMLAVSDLFIGFHNTMLFTYGSVLLISCAVRWLRQHKNFKNTVAMGFISSLFFFMITNFGVWLVGGLYPQTMPGLVDCFILAIPFCRNELISTFLYSALLFYGYEVMAARLKSARLA